MSRQAFPGFMGEAPARSKGSLKSSQDLVLSASGDFHTVLGPADSVEDPKFKIVDVAGNVIWSEEDQSHVFQEKRGRKDVLVFRLVAEDVSIPTTGASLYIRIGDEETKFSLIRKPTVIAEGSDQSSHVAVREDFPGFMAAAPVYSDESLPISQDLTVSPSGDFYVVLGPVASVVAPKFRIVDVAGNVLWAEDDQSHVFQESRGGKDVLVFRLGGEDVNIPTTGASLYIRISDEETKFSLIRKSSPFEPTTVESDDSAETPTPAPAPIPSVEIKSRPEDDDVFDYYEKREGIYQRVRLTWANIITTLRELFYTKSEIDSQLEELAGELTAYTFTQTTPAALWIINHNLGYRPSVTILRDGVTPVEGLVSHPSTIQTRVNFLTEITGTARLV